MYRGKMCSVDYAIEYELEYGQLPVFIMVIEGPFLSS